jgi:hypothetical protein
LTWAQIFDACERNLPTRQEEEDGQSTSGHDRETDSQTREQTWRDQAPEYLSNSNAVKIARNKLSAPALSKLLRKPGNTVRWMRNTKTRRSRVHAQDFKRYLRNQKFPDEFTEAAFIRQQEIKKEIDARKKETGK